MQRSGGNARGVHGDVPKGHVAVLAAGIFVLSDDDGVRKFLAHGDPGLLAGKPVSAVGLLLSDAGHGAIVGASARLGDGQRSDRPAGLHVVVNGLLLLLFGAELHDVEHGQGVLIEDMHAASAVVKLLDHQAQRDFVSRDSAVLLRNTHQAKASVAICLGDLVGHAAVLVHFLHDVVGEIAIAELAHAFEQQLLLIGQSEIHCFLLVKSRLFDQPVPFATRRRFRYRQNTLFLSVRAWSVPRFWVKIGRFAGHITNSVALWFDI